MPETRALYVSTADVAATAGLDADNRQLVIPSDWLLPNGLQLPTDLTTKEWEDIGWSFLFLDEVGPWAIGDWYNDGVARYKARSVTAYLERLRRDYPYLRLSQLKLKTIRNYASICKSFPLHSRTWEHLTFWHYYKVAGYEPEERIAHLKHGNTMEMTLNQFEAYLQEQDGNRQKDEDHSQRMEDLVARNEHLQDENDALTNTVEYYRDELETARAEADGLRVAVTARRCPNCGYEFKGDE